MITGSQSCPFCSDSLRTRTIAESELAVAFVARHGVARGQSLVAPKRHVESFLAMSQAEATDVLLLAQTVAGRLIGTYKYTGINLIVNDGTDAGQTVPHCHLHVVPRRHDDIPDPRRWLSTDLWQRWREYSEAELAEIAAVLRARSGA